MKLIHNEVLGKVKNWDLDPSPPILNFLRQTSRIEKSYFLVDFQAIKSNATQIAFVRSQRDSFKIWFEWVIPNRNRSNDRTLKVIANSRNVSMALGTVLRIQLRDVL